MNSQWNTLKESLAAFWMERQVRERQAIAVASLLIVLAIIDALLIEPALSGRAQLQKNLPSLRQQAAELQALTKQALELGKVSAAPVAGVTKESLEADLIRQGLKPQNVLVAGDLIKVQFAQVSFAGVVRWLNDIQKTARLALSEANIEALPAIDTVNANLTLRQQRNDRLDE